MEEFNVVTTEKPDDIRTETSESSTAADDSPKTSHEEPQTIPEAPNSEVEHSEMTPSTPPPVLTTSGRKRPPYKYDPNKVTLRFVFANRDGLAVTIECRPADTVGDVKHALLSAWPEGKYSSLLTGNCANLCFKGCSHSIYEPPLDLPNCSGGERLRLICMGKGILTPDARSLEDCQIPVFKTHPTPINVSIKPDAFPTASEKHARHGNTSQTAGGSSSSAGRTRTTTTSQGCSCSIL